MCFDCLPTQDVGTLLGGTGRHLIMVGTVAGSLILPKPSSEPWPALLPVPLALALPVQWKEASLDDGETSSIPPLSGARADPALPPSSSLPLLLSCALQLCKMCLD